MTKAECVAAYVDAGFALFPCGRGDDGKQPWLKDWRDTKPDVTLTANDLHSMYGVVLPPEVIVLDYDPRRDLDYDNGDGAFDSQLQLLWQELKLEAVPTFTVQTAGGGLHLYYTKPPEVHTRGRLKGLSRAYDAIDFKSFGGYVIAAGSTNNSKNGYKIISGSVQNLGELAAPILSCLNFIPSERTSESDSEFTDAATRESYVRFCQTRNGEDGSYVTACYGRDLGLTASIVLEVMREVYNPLRSIPKEDEQLEEKIAHAFQYGQNAQGSKNPITKFTETSSNAAPLFSPDTRAHDNKIKEGLPGVLPDNGKVADFHGTTGLVQSFNAKGEPTGVLPILTNALHYLRLPHDGRDTFNTAHNLFRYNKFSQVIELTRKAVWHNLDPYEDFEGSAHSVLSDYDILKVQEDLASRKAPLIVSKEVVRDAITVVSHDNEYHPIRNWLKDLKWDKIARLDEWLINYLSSPDTLYTREIAKNTLIAAVARVMQPGCKHDHMLILENEEQGTRKSEVVKVLGGKYAADIHIDLSSSKGVTDTTAGMLGAWFLEASELEFMRRTDVGALKRFLSLSSDKVRLPYAHYHCTLPRQSLFIGTINPTQHGYLQDSTGNRRFWAVPTGRIDISQLRADREQLFAEAYHRYMGREPWWIVDERINAIAKGEANKRMVKDSWQDIISYWLQSSKLPDLMTTENIGYYALNMRAMQMNKSEQMRISNAMHALGYASNQKRVKGARIRVWEFDIV